MKIPQEPKVGFCLHRKSPVCQGKGLSETCNETKKTDSPFEVLLDDLFRYVTEKANMPFQAPPIDRDHLQYLVHAIQAEMNNSLFSAVLGDDEDNAVFQYGEPLMGIPRMDVPLEPDRSSVLQPGENTGASPYQRDVEQIVDHAAQAHGVDKALITAVIKTESDFDPHCTSAKGAMGLMQLMPETAKELGVQNPFDPVENVMGGTRYLKSLLDRYDGNVPLALAAYNWGMGNVERHPGRLPRETRLYISRVNQYYQEGTV